MEPIHYVAFTQSTEVTIDDIHAVVTARDERRRNRRSLLRSVAASLPRRPAPAMTPATTATFVS